MNSIRRQFSRYTVAGLLGTAAHFVTLIMLVQWLAVAPVSASLGGAIVGALINYQLNYRFTFLATSTHRSTLPKYLLIAASAILLNTLIMSVLVTLMSLPYIAAQLLTTLLVLLWTFTLNRLWTFRSTTHA